VKINHRHAIFTARQLGVLGGWRGAGLLARADIPCLHLVESLDDGQALFIAAERHGLEGIVSKLRDVPYRSGECREWVKIKNRRLARCRPGTMAIA
jgi:hypothetical protein